MTLSKTCYVLIHAYTLSEYLPPTHAYTHTRFRIFLSYKGSIPFTRANEFPSCGALNRLTQA
jgi:hypothetical protein